MGKRIKWLDELRGSAILLVVLGHLSLIGKTPEWYVLLNLVIYSFHMPLFFAMSGLLFGMKNGKGKECKPETVIKKKIISIGIPYIIFSEIYIFLLDLTQAHIQTNTQIDLSVAYRILWSPIAHYWFLWVLLIYFIFTVLIRKNDTAIFASVIVSMIIFVIGKDRDWYNTFSYFFSFGGGMLIGENYRNISRRVNDLRKPLVLGISTFIIFIIDAICFFRVSNWQRGWCSAVNRLLLVFLGIIGFSSVVLWIGKIKWIGNFLIILGNKSWYIYLLHSYFLSAGRVVIGKIGCSSIFAEIIIGMVIACGGPMLVSLIVDRIKIFEFCFYPQKFIV